VRVPHRLHGAGYLVSLKVLLTAEGAFGRVWRSVEVSELIMGEIVGLAEVRIVLL